VERLLVTGIDTVVGVNLAESLCDRFEVLGACRAPWFESSQIRVEAHGDQPERLVKLARDWQPHWVIACGSFSAAAWDDVSGPSPHELECVRRLAALAGEMSASMAVVSSDIVFAGPRMFHDESMPPSNSTARARHALVVEQAVAGTAALIARTHAYGWSSGGDVSFAERAYQAIQDGVAIAADGYRHSTPILATDLAALLARAYELRLTGCYHLTGAERTSPHRFASVLAAECGGRWPERAATHGYKESGLEETSLSSKRARRALKTPTPLLHEGLARFVQQAAEGWSSRWSKNPRRALKQELAA
jgi:dTDP-4-dehydrorhamnose reductase